MINQLYSNKSAGRDSVKAEQLRHGTENIAKEIATIYNKIATTEKYPNKINQG